MNKGIEILLSRMESHPDEFGGSDYVDTWGWALYPICRRAERIQKGGDLQPDITSPKPFAEYPFLTDEEVMQVYRKFQELQGDAFTRRVMQQLLDPQDVATSTSSPMPRLGSKGGVYVGSATLTARRTSPFIAEDVRYLLEKSEVDD
jgi:hypothetical protein